jgi:DNA-directed RNA polymerase specialized sigma24 family protein
VDFRSAVFEKAVRALSFTLEEFDTMVQEILYQEPSSYDMLCRITVRTVMPLIRKFCSSVPCLKWRGLEEDFAQDVCVLAMSGVVDKFLLKDGVNAPVNYAPEGFGPWLNEVARNWILDYIRRNKGRITVPLEEELLLVLGEDTDDIWDLEERRERLKKALELVLDAYAGIYKVLTWLAMFTFMLGEDISKIESNDRIVAAFEERTLNEMYEMICAEAVRIPWMQISPERDAAIRKALREPFDEDRTYGEVTYSGFYMKYQGAPSGKKSISDWVNRMNGIIRKQLTEPPQQEVPKLKKPKRCPKGRAEGNGWGSGDDTGSTLDEKTRRDENASSNS